MNIFGCFCMARAALRYLPAGSAIVNTGSDLEESKQLLDYCATKGAIHAFTKALAQQLVERKIRVNCVAPGYVLFASNADSSYITGEVLTLLGGKTSAG